MTAPSLMTSLTTIAQWLAGEFDNQAQALDQPVWFVHLRLWHRPLPFQIDGCPALFAEQANALYPGNPYRQRVMVLQMAPEAQTLQVQYFAFKQPDRIRGAGANPELLKTITHDDLERLSGCILTITQQGSTFKATPEPDTQCCFQYNGQTRQVVLGFEVRPDLLLSYDRGVDPDTGKALWGAIMGAYEFRKCQDFAAEWV